MMRMLELQDGDPIHMQGTRLPKGQFVKLQPQTVDFLEISDPKAVYVWRAHAGSSRHCATTRHSRAATLLRSRTTASRSRS